MEFRILRIPIEKYGYDHIGITNRNRTGESFFINFLGLMFVIKIGFNVQTEKPVVGRDRSKSPGTHTLGFKN
jgi:hypothetical protein